MLQLTIGGTEYFDQKTSEFITVKPQTIQLEHSLVSIAKWESKWHKPYLGDKPKTVEEEMDYIRCMTVTQNVDPLAYSSITGEQLKKIHSYISDTMTATWFSNTQKRGNTKGEAVTAELIYYWMIEAGVPFECQKWHLNRLLTLIRVCNIKNSPAKKMSKKDIYKQNAALNAARRKKLGTSG